VTCNILQETAYGLVLLIAKPYRLSMRCLFACSADSYNIVELAQELKNSYPVRREKDALHVEFEQGVVFYFAYGCFVAWGLTPEQEKKAFKLVKPFEKAPLASPHVDHMAYHSGESFKIVDDELILANNSTLTLLAASHSLAQSVKLDAYEKSVDQTVESTRHLPEQMAKKGRIGLSRREIRRKMGELFIERNSINLHSDVLDKPEFFWSYPEVEPVYTMIANYLDITPRVEVLNQRLGVVHELFEILNSELNHQQSSRLEWVIIILIFIEVGITLMKDVFGWL